MRELEWDVVRDWFDPVQNGSVPDIAVEDTTLEDWQAFLELIRADGWRAEYTSTAMSVSRFRRWLPICSYPTRRTGRGRCGCGPGRTSS
ncbi:hypothetical protein Ait01nite_015030 [Actinoplanes italicus]|uniref:Uncharacterized protein n=1 Tax=Actinoplanes italicus TaxID=113567 RepID=A0A2T0KHM8_9ACTN|nr:hypothetical protein [Actinoplanes italicus]PRX22936.1 hypothetical protein CLV67_104464 [Actinoplanes italicus]GIE28458.1 hypothetical protein Ait01nite_015030 [Actinoplanes italicus]